MEKVYNPLADSSREYLPMFYDFKTYHDRRDYVESEMRKAHLDGCLYLTGMMMLGSEVRDIVGDIVLDFTRSNGQVITQRKADEYPDFLENAKFNIVSQSGDSEIQYQDGKSKASINYVMHSVNGFGSNRDRLVIKRPRHMSAKSGSLSARQAYLALKQRGAFVENMPDRKTGSLPGNSLIEIPPWQSEREDASEDKNRKRV